MELYDLQTDRGDSVNLAGAPGMEAVVARLRRDLEVAGGLPRGLKGGEVVGVIE
jgi:hypothetical protein